jgi:uncharacterized membrane protein
MNNTSKKTFQLGTPVCGLLCGLIAIVIALAFLFLGFWRTLFVAVFFAVGYAFGAFAKKPSEDEQDEFAAEEKE